MSRNCCGHWVSLLVMAGLMGCYLYRTTKSPQACDPQALAPEDSFLGSKAGQQREVASGKLCWCPAGRFMMAKSSASKSEHGDISRVRRGGCWADEGWPCRSAFRLRFEPERRHDHIGFRVVAVCR